MLASVMVKQYYMFMVGSVDEENFEVELEGFEEDFKNMLEVWEISVFVSGLSGFVPLTLQYM